jgi:uncharacterized membrane protein YkoI
MIKQILSSLVLVAIATTAPLAARPPHREQDAALRGTQDGRFIPLRVIESRVVARMPGYSYLGPELDAAEGRYRLKFMRSGRVIWIDIDARTGEIMSRSGD